jgi:CRISPR-associated endoribonuclease Cas6
MNISENSSLSVAIPVTSITVNLDLESENPVSGFIGATFRGGFGYTLKSLVCITKQEACSGCIFVSSCSYAFLFETSPQPDSVRMSKYKSVPHPFAMRAIQDKNSLSVELVLFGDAYKFIPHFIYTFNKLGTNGIGKNKVKYRVRDALWGDQVIYPLDNNEVFTGITPGTITVSPGEPEQGAVRLKFLSPLTIRKDGRELSCFDTYSFFTSLLRRTTNLNAFYGVEKNAQVDPHGFIDGVNDMELRENLRRENLSRYSTRQEKRLDYSGLTGEVTLIGDIGTVMPLLRAGEITGVGKNTVFGSGVYKVEVVS